ncbi:unnamed protein product [Closterium sp. NIES-54]
MLGSIPNAAPLVALPCPALPCLSCHRAGRRAALCSPHAALCSLLHRPLQPARRPAGRRAALCRPRAALLHPAAPPLAARAPPFAPARRPADARPAARSPAGRRPAARTALMCAALLLAPPGCCPPCWLAPSCPRRPAAAHPAVRRPAARRPAARAPPCCPRAALLPECHPVGSRTALPFPARSFSALVLARRHACVPPSWLRATLLCPLWRLSVYSPLIMRAWLTRDAAARLAVRNHLPLAERAHCGQHKTAKALYDASDSRYSSLATAALGRLILPYLFPELDHFLAINPTDLTVDLLEKHLLADETSIVAVGAARGTPRTPFFEGCFPSPLAPSYASAGAVNIIRAEDVRPASALSGKRRSSKGKGGKSGGSVSGGGGGGGSGGGGGGGGGGSGGSGGGTPFAPPHSSPRDGGEQRSFRPAPSAPALPSVSGPFWSLFLCLTYAVSAPSLPTGSATTVFSHTTPLSHALRLLVAGLPRSLPPLPPSPAPPCLPCDEGRQCAAPHSSSFPPTSAPLQALHMDVWGPARVSGWDLRLQLRKRFREDLLVLRLQSDRGGEFSSDLLRDFCRGEGILQSFPLPASPQQNGVTERRIGLVMEVARTSMIHAAAPHFLWLFAVRYAAHQLNLWPRVSLLETSPTLRWTGKVCDASVFWVWGSRAFLRDTSAHKLSSRAIPCVFLGFPSAALPCSMSPSGRPSPPLGSCSLRCVSGGPTPRDCACRGATSGGVAFGGVEPASVESGGAQPGGAEPGGAEPGGVECEGAESGGAEPRVTASAGAGGAGAISLGGVGVTAGAGDIGGTGAASPGGARLPGSLCCTRSVSDRDTAFLQGSLHEEIWLRRSPGFTGSFPPGNQWSLWWLVYGLHQAPRKWHDTLRTTLANLGFAPSSADLSVFLRTDTSLPPLYVLVYVEDLVFATADTEALALVKSELQRRHTCTDLGELRSYLGLQITRDKARRTITLTQSHMVHQVLQRFGFRYSSPQSTPLPTDHSLSAPPSVESVEPSGPYPKLVGCLMVLRYLCNTSGMGLVLGGRGPAVLNGHADASWVDDLATQRSSQGYTFILGSSLVSWRSTRSSFVLSSSCEAEIYAGAMAALELCWLTYLLTNLGEPPRSSPLLYVDNKAMIALYQEHRLEHRTKHIALRYFLARELEQRGQLRLAYVATRANTADIFTKTLQSSDHQRFCTVLGLVPTLPHLLTA